jgi:PST family polysaccharide transporter
LDSRLRTLIAGPGAQRAAGNLGWLLAERVLRLGLNFGVGIWVSRYLGPEQFGSLSYVMALVAVASILAELGLEAVVRREVIATPEAAASAVAAARLLRFAGGMAGYVLLGAVVALGGTNPEERILLLVLGLTLFQPALLAVDLWFQARLEAKYSTIAQTCALAGGAAVRIALVLGKAPLTAFAWAAVGEMIIAAVLLGLLAQRRGLNAPVRGVNRPLMKRLLEESWPLMASGFAVVLYMRIDAVMLRAIRGESDVGIYAAATRFAEIWYFVPVALASSLLPAILRARERGDEAYRRRWQQVFDMNAALAFAIAIAGALTAPWLVQVCYGEAYAASAGVMVLHIWSCLFVFLGVARGQWLVNEKHSYFYLASSAAGAGANVALNAWLIPGWGAKGAAIATLISFAGSAWLSSFFHPGVREVGWMQTRALLIPLLGWRYLRRS